MSYIVSTKLFFRIKLKSKCVRTSLFVKKFYFFMSKGILEIAGDNMINPDASSSYILWIRSILYFNINALLQIVGLAVIIQLKPT